MISFANLLMLLFFIKSIPFGTSEILILMRKKSLFRDFIILDKAVIQCIYPFVITSIFVA